VITAIPPNHLALAIGVGLGLGLPLLALLICRCCALSGGPHPKIAVSTAEYPTAPAAADAEAGRRWVPTGATPPVTRPHPRQNTEQLPPLSQPPQPPGIDFLRHLRSGGPPVAPQQMQFTSRTLRQGSRQVLPPVRQSAREALPDAIRQVSRRALPVAVWQSSVASFTESPPPEFRSANASARGRWQPPATGPPQPLPDDALPQKPFDPTALGPAFVSLHTAPPSRIGARQTLPDAIQQVSRQALPVAVWQSSVATLTERPPLELHSANASTRGRWQPPAAVSMLSPLQPPPGDALPQTPFAPTAPGPVFVSVRTAPPSRIGAERAPLRFEPSHRRPVPPTFRGRRRARWTVARVTVRVVARAAAAPPASRGRPPLRRANRPNLTLPASRPATAGSRRPPYAGNHRRGRRRTRMTMTPASRRNQVYARAVRESRFSAHAPPTSLVVVVS